MSAIQILLLIGSIMLFALCYFVGTLIRRAGNQSLEEDKPTQISKITHKFLWFGKKEVKEKIEPNTVVFDQVKGRKLEYIDQPLGRQWRYTNKLLYCMKRTINGTLSVIEPPSTLETMPEDLYNALHDDYVCEFMVAKSSLWRKLSTMAIYICIFAVVILIVLLIGRKA